MSAQIILFVPRIGPIKGLMDEDTKFDFIECLKRADKRRAVAIFDEPCDISFIKGTKETEK